MPIMPHLPGFCEPDSNKRFPNEQEGFGKALSHDETEVPRCSSVLVSTGNNNADFRGYMPASGHTQKETNFIEWETTPAELQDDCTFCFIMNTHAYPEFRPAYPYVTATLTVADTVRIPIPIADPRYYQTTREGVCVYFEPRRFASMVESYHRKFSPHGVSGIYRITVPAALITKGKPVRIKFMLDKTDMDVVTYAALSPRKNVLALSLATLRDELTQLQADVTELKLSHAMLQAKIYPELFPQYLKARRGVAVVEETWHMPPPTLCKYDGDNLLITYRRATDHLAADGACWAVRSFDKGETFTQPELLFDLGKHDHRSTPALQISNGDLVAGDYRVGGGYDADGKYHGDKTLRTPTLWGVWSTDRGKTWNFSDKPIIAPGMDEFPYVEMERPIIELPNGRLLLTGMYCKQELGNDFGMLFAMGVWYSDDKGRHWEYLSSTDLYTGAKPPHVEAEPTFARCRSGKIVMLMRSEPHGVTDWENKGSLIQCESHDDGKTWTKPHKTEMSSLSTPAHLILLANGRLLATHASRKYPGSIYLTLSNDEGETWNTHDTKIVVHDIQDFDSTYPTSVQFSDGSLITVWYASRFGRFHIGYAAYKLEDIG